MKKTGRLTPNLTAKAKSDDILVEKIKYLATPEASAWLFAGLAAVTLSIYALFVEPNVLQWPEVGHRSSVVFLFGGLGIISCLVPVTAPRLAQRIYLTPIVALASALILPPALATLPMMLAAIISITLQEETSERRRLLGHFLLIILSQISSSILLLVWRMGPSQNRIGVNSDLMNSILGTVLFGSFYLGGLYVQLSRQNRSSRFGWPDSSWHVGWTNETAVFCASSPFAVMVAFIFLHNGSISGGACAVVLATFCAWVSKLLIERKMLAKQLAVMENLTEFSALSKSPNRKRLVEEFLVHSRSLVLYDYARVWLFNDSDAILSCTSEHPIRKSHSSIGKMRRIGESLIGRVAERGSSMIVQDVRRDIRHPIHKFSERQKTQIGPIAQMILPLIVNGETMGVVEFERRQWGAFNIADRNRIQGLITLVAMGLANIRQHQDVMQLAATDGLTGMYNKRHIMTLLQDEMRRGERYSRPLAVLMMDIDYFKNYNDTYGHVQGDTLLAQMSMIIQESIRSTDRAGRYGGEEFIIVMPETDKEAAFSTAERIRQRIEMTPFPGKPKAPDTLPASLSDCFPETAETWVRKTISIGVSCFPRDAHDLTSLVALADDALYQAKRAGRNRVIAASEARQPRAAST